MIIYCKLQFRNFYSTGPSCPIMPPGGSIAPLLSNEKS
jgi:hypothetical protein